MAKINLTSRSGTARIIASINTEYRQVGKAAVAQMYGLSTGNTLSFQQFVNTFAASEPKVAAISHINNIVNITPRDVVKIVDAYTTVNNTLIHDGYVLKAKNYYSSFEVIPNSVKYDRLKGAIDTKMNMVSLTLN